MASPVFHGLAGAGRAYLLAGDARLPLFASLRKDWIILGVAAALACLPDVDFLPGLLAGDLNAFHQKTTHSVAWVLLASAGLWLVGRAWRPAWFGRRAALFIFLLIGSHLAIDLVSEDRRPPYGIPLWAPFSEAAVQAPFALLPAWDKATLAELGSAANLRPLAIEGIAGLALAAGCIGAKRGWTRRQTAL
jgi:inner membrane protein